MSDLINTEIPQADTQLLPAAQPQNADARTDAVLAKLSALLAADGQDIAEFDTFAELAKKRA